MDFIFIFLIQQSAVSEPDLLRLVKFEKTSCDGTDVNSAQDLLALLSSPLSICPLHPCLPYFLHLPLCPVFVYVLVRGHHCVVFISSLHSVLGIPLEMLFPFPN